MKLRTKVGLAFFLLSAVPLAGIVLYSYSTSRHAFRQAVEAETQAMTEQLGARIATISADMERLVTELGQLPLPLLLTDQLGDDTDFREVYSQLIEGIGEAAQFVEWFEFTPEDGEGLIIFPSETLANALQKLERYEGLDAETSAALRGSMEAILEGAITRRSQMPPEELETLDASAERSRRLLGTDFRSPVEVDDREVGTLSVQVRPTPLLRSALARSRSSGEEIPYALDPSGQLYVANLDDEEALDALRQPGQDGTRPTLAGGDNEDWMVIEDRSTGHVGEATLVYGIARPIGASLQVIRQSALSNFVVGLAIAALALVAAMLLTNRLTRNVGILTVGAERLARGDLQVRVPEGSKDELGQLARTFNRMALELSEKEERILEEERLRKEQEFQQRMLQAENDRKTHELEEARRFQLSLLPKTLPTLPGLEIGVHMTTATEVGGDYYDFFQSPNGGLVAALGDATGHGSRAGTMATVIKGMLSLGAGADLPAFLQQANTAICGMKLDRMSMSLALARIENGTIDLATAGMPPALLYRAATGEVEEIALEGTPLGGFSNYRFQQWRSAFAPGDTLLMMSDGLPELLDHGSQPLGYPRVASAFQSVAQNTPNEIIEALEDTARDWNDGAPPSDDMTFVVFKSAQTR